MNDPATLDAALRLGQYVAAAVVGATTVWGARKVRKHRQVQREEGEAVEFEDDDDRRLVVRRSEFNVLVRKITDLVRKVEDLVDSVRDHKNRLDEHDRDRLEIKAALRDVLDAIARLPGANG